MDQKEYAMTTMESFKKFGMEPRGVIGCALMGLGVFLALIGLAVVIVDRVTGKFGLEGVILIAVLLIFIGGGAGLFIAGRNNYLQDKKRIKALTEAWETRRCVMADIVSIREETSSEKTSDNMFTGVSYRKYYVVECHYTDPDGVVHIYYRNLYHDPTGKIKGTQVPVYYVPGDDKLIYVDIEQVMTPD